LLFWSSVDSETFHPNYPFLRSVISSWITVRKVDELLVFYFAFLSIFLMFRDRFVRTSSEYFRQGAILAIKNYTPQRKFYKPENQRWLLTSSFMKPSQILFIFSWRTFVHGNGFKYSFWWRRTLRFSFSSWSRVSGPLWIGNALPLSIYRILELVVGLFACISFRVYNTN